MLWGGRFSEPTDDDLRALNDSFSFDRRLYAQDIAGSAAYARALGRAGVLESQEVELILDGLQRVHVEFEMDVFVPRPGDEDIHTAVERRLIELVGPVGGKLHTGRSRNDQVATDFRLWVMAALDRVNQRLEDLQGALLARSGQHLTTIMPGYTHLQPAQPITAAHWLMSFFWMIARDRERLRETRRRAAVCPLGSGALAGTPFMIDRVALAADLGMEAISHNSLDAVSDRDFAAEAVFVLALMGTHLSRLAEDIILYSNPQFGFVTLHDRYSTGSSLMPQKRNADPMELARGKTGRLIGHVTGLLATLKGLPSAYNKDLQEDKEGVFDAFDTADRLLPVLTGVIQTLQLNPDRMRAALNDELLATDLADYLVAKGVPFRESHRIIGQIVRVAAERQQSLSAVDLNTLRTFSERFEADVEMVFQFAASVSRRRVAGGTAPEAVRLQLEAAQRWLSAFGDRPG